MFKKLPKIIILFFLIVFIFQLASLIFLMVAPESSNAAGIQFNPQVTIPGEADGLKIKEGVPVNVGTQRGNVLYQDLLPKYIKLIYKYAIGIVGILAAVVLMFGGVLWITAGGNNERISNAKSWIAASLSGLVLALCSYMILYQINPDLTQFEPIKVSNVDEKKSDYTNNPNYNCEWIKTSTDQYVSDTDICSDIVNDSYCNTNKPSDYYFCCCEKSKINSEYCQGKKAGISCTTESIEGYCKNGACKTCETLYAPCSENYECCDYDANIVCNLGQCRQLGCCLFDWNSPEWDACNDGVTEDRCKYLKGVGTLNIYDWLPGVQKCNDKGGWFNDNYECK